MTSVQMSLFLFLECAAALRWQIAAVSDRVSQKLRCSRLPDKKAPVHSNIGTSEWRSWKLSFVALATNGGCATLAWCDRISEYQWWTVLPRSGHSADVAGVLRWHRITAYAVGRVNEAVSGVDIVDTARTFEFVLRFCRLFSTLFASIKSMAEWLICWLRR